MKKTLSLAFSTAALFLMVACNNGDKAGSVDTTATTSQNANPQMAQFSSAMGVLMGTDFQNMGIASNLNMADFRKGLESVMVQNQPLMEPMAAGQVIEPVFVAAGKQETMPSIPQDFSLALGVVMGTQFTQGLPPGFLEPNGLIASIESTLKGQNTMTREVAEQTLQSIMQAEQEKIMAEQQKMMADQQAQMAAQQPQLEGPGKSFLAENATKKNIKTTASGLQYEVIKEGKGKKPTLDNKVTVHYHGTLIDGTVFDSSVDRGETISFPLNGVIKGWQEGLQLMSEGSKYRLYIPHEIGYGAQQAGSIPPFSTLIFDVELFKVE